MAQIKILHCVIKVQATNILATRARERRDALKKLLSGREKI